MGKKLVSLTFLALFINLFLLHAQKKLVRAESFFGFHFDFHATAADKELGKNFDIGLLDTFLTRTRPDYIQVDSKGHPGYSSYPTKVGYSGNSFVCDPLRIWRDATNRHNVALYVHYSGLLDIKAMHEHPEWARIKADGSKDSSVASYLGDYSGKLLIPQLEEMINAYGIDGVWIDGDCWSTAPDYSPEVIKGFIKEAGINEVPLKETDANYNKWLDYNRLVYRRYLGNYVNVLHQYKQDFQVASAWAYSSMMPEKVDVNVDFLSADEWRLYNIAFQSRCMALQGKPWDMMAWSFIPIDFGAGIHSPKSLVQLEQQAAEVMAIGGGFEVYFQQNRDASFRTIDVDAMAKLADFCRKRQPFCQYSEVTPQIGMWYSVKGWKSQTNGVYGSRSNMEGINSLILDGQYSVEVLMDHQIKERMGKYRIIIIPELDQFDEDIKEQLMRYVAAGGNLLIIGAKASASFKKELGVSFIGQDTSVQCNIGDRSAGGIAGLKTVLQKVIPNPGTEVIGHIYSQGDFRYATEYPVATINSYGKGKIAALYLDMSAAYNTYRNPVFNKLLNNIINRLTPDLELKVLGSDQVHVVLGSKNGNILVHLINASGAHLDAYDEIFPTPPLTVRLKVHGRPGSAKLQPGNKEIPFSYRNDYIELSIPPVEVYTIVEVVQ